MAWAVRDLTFLYSKVHANEPPIGIMRSFLVYPTYMVYPSLLPTVQLFDALHRGKKIFLQKKRVRFFWSCFIAIFIWEWFPEYIAPCVLPVPIPYNISRVEPRTLTGISIFCLAKRDSPWFTRIFGIHSPSYSSELVAEPKLFRRRCW